MYLQEFQKAIHLHHCLFIQYAILSSCININSKYNYDCHLTLSLIITYIVILYLHFKALLLFTQP